MYVFSGLVIGLKSAVQVLGRSKEKIKIDSPENMKDGNQSDCCGCIRNF